MSFLSSVTGAIGNVVDGAVHGAEDLANGAVDVAKDVAHDAPKVVDAGFDMLGHATAAAGTVGLTTAVLGPVFGPLAGGAVLGLGAPSGDAQPAPANGPWSAENEDQIKGYISQAMNDNHGDVAKAFAQLRDLRQDPSGAHYYDTNLAIAADYLRARWDTQREGPAVEYTKIDAYLAAKRTVGVPKEGPGPVSPYSDLEAKYMYQGVKDQVNNQSFWQNAWQASPPGLIVGAGREALSELGSLLG